MFFIWPRLKICHHDAIYLLVPGRYASMTEIAAEGGRRASYMKQCIKFLMSPIHKRSSHEHVEVGIQSFDLKSYLSNKSINNTLRAPKYEEKVVNFFIWLTIVLQNKTGARQLYNS
ncbi:hypothetical protein AVEN_166876-1 [Araneus ventricosus]|uniref:Uncharacterized protein n=1 Tax=Araneus ventricosus TaxID=182803 RepID=A0A4Y2H914_ARAVE|nr:hypothetical protein AVEN_166876-1 [Araneus ventricosus]